MQDTISVSAILYGIGIIAVVYFVWNLVGSILKSITGIATLLIVVYVLSMNNIILPVGVSREMNRIFMEYKNTVINWVSDKSKEAVDSVQKPAAQALDKAVKSATDVSKQVVDKATKQANKIVGK